MEIPGKQHNDGLTNTLIATFIVAILSIPFFVETVYILPIVTFGILFLAYLAINEITIPYIHLVYLLITLSILSPPLNLSNSLPLIRIEELIIYGVFPLILILNFNHIRLSKEAKQFVQIYSAFIVFAIISTFYGYIVLDVPPSVRDLFEIITISKYLLVFATVYSFNLNLKEIKKVFYYVLYIILISGIFGLLQYFGVLGLDNITGPLFLQDRFHIIHERLTATYKNPNTYSAILVTGHLIALGLFFFEERKSKKTFLLLCITLISVFLLFTGSRTMIAAYFLVTFIMAIIGVYRSGYKASQIFVLLGILGIAFVSAISIISYEIIVRLQSGLDILSDESFAIRLIVWYLNLLIFLESPFLGWGPAKDLHTTVVDNEYIFILRRYGVLGFLTFIGFYFHPLYHAYQNLKSGSKTKVLLCSFILCIIITYLIAALTNSLYHSSQVMDFWVVILALFYLTLKDETSTNIYND